MHSHKTERGQAMAEMALVTPVLVLLFFGMTLAAFYAFRASAADWGVYIHGHSASTWLKHSAPSSSSLSCSKALTPRARRAQRLNLCSPHSISHSQNRKLPLDKPEHLCYYHHAIPGAGAPLPAPSCFLYLTNLPILPRRE